MPPFTRDDADLGAALSVIGGGFLTAMRHYAAQHDLEIEGLPQDPKADLPPDRSSRRCEAFSAAFSRS